MGEVALDVFLGDPPAEYPFGDPLVEITFGVPCGVRRGVIYGVIENLFPAYLEPIKAIKKKGTSIHFSGSVFLTLR